MWVEELKNGKVRYVERYVNPLTLKTEKVSVTMDRDTRPNRKSAQSVLQDRIQKKLNELSSCLKNKNITLSQLYELYFKYLESSVKKSTYARNKTAAHSMINILGGDIVVNNLTAAYVKQCLALQDEKSGTTNERIKRFKAFVRWAYENELIEDIRWIDKLKPLKDDDKKRKLEEKFLEAEELTLLLDNIKIEKWRFLAELTALSGMRCGEAIALEDSDIDFDNRIIKITKTYDHVHKIVTSPKTGDSDREVYMQDQLFKLCKSIKKFMSAERILMGYRSKLFISDAHGDYVGYAAYNKHLRVTSAKVLGKQVTSHYMRHTHVALLAEQGVSLDVISRRLGHSDSQITKRIYFHVTNKLKERDNAQIQNIKII
jgi:integrase